jgi:hypothetical protein
MEKFIGRFIFVAVISSVTRTLQAPLENPRRGLNEIYNATLVNKFLHDLVPQD